MVVHIALVLSGAASTCQVLTAGRTPYLRAVASTPHLFPTARGDDWRHPLLPRRQSQSSPVHPPAPGFFVLPRGGGKHHRKGVFQPSRSDDMHCGGLAQQVRGACAGGWGRLPGRIHRWMREQVQLGEVGVCSQCEILHWWWMTPDTGKAAGIAAGGSCISAIPLLAGWPGDDSLARAPFGSGGRRTSAVEAARLDAPAGRVFQGFRMAIGPAGLRRVAEPYAARRAFLISASTFRRARLSDAAADITCRTARWPNRNSTTRWRHSLTRRQLSAPTEPARMFSSRVVRGFIRRRHRTGARSRTSAGAHCCGTQLVR